MISGKYGPNVTCTVKYLMKEDCAEMKFFCKKFNFKNNKKCSKGDILVLSNEYENKTYGLSNIIKYLISSTQFLREREEDCVPFKLHNDGEIRQ